LLKKLLALAVVKKGIDLYREARRPQKPAWRRSALPAGLVLALGAGAAYAVKSGKAGDLIKQLGGPTTNEIPPPGSPVA
jgi:hypothetical protein